MAYFAIEIHEEVKRVIFVESPNEDQAATDYKQGDEVWTRRLDEDISEVRELTEEQFKNRQLPEVMK